MLKLSKMTDYAVVILADMVRQDSALLSASQIAQSTNLSEATVSKILKLLTKHDILTSTRGANGGYQLNKNPKEINMADVIAATDAPLALTDCVEGGSQCCGLAESCSVKGQWNPVNVAMRTALENVSLQQMMGGNHNV